MVLLPERYRADWLVGMVVCGRPLSIVVMVLLVNPLIAVCMRRTGG